jgi:hypothetical protein
MIMPDPPSPPPEPQHALDPAQMVAKLPIGSVVYGFAEEEEGVWHTDFFVRERSDVLYQMALEPRLDMKVGAVESNGVLLVLLLFTFNPKLGVYVTWWNIHSPTNGPGDLHPFDAMERHEQPINFWFVGDSGTTEYQLQSRHRLQVFFREIRKQAEPYPAWTPEQFAREKADVAKDLPDDPMVLWKQME